MDESRPGRRDRQLLAGLAALALIAMGPSSGSGDSLASGGLDDTRVRTSMAHPAPKAEPSPPPRSQDASKAEEQAVPSGSVTDEPAGEAPDEPPVRGLDGLVTAGTLTVLLAGLFVGGLLGGITGRAVSSGRTRRREPTQREGHGGAHHSEFAPVDTPESGRPEGSTEAGTDRRVIDGLIASFDLATNDAQRERLRETLRLAGVHAIEPSVLTPFDPRLHNALGIESDGDQGRAGLIARVQRIGWRHNESLLRAPEITVYPQVGTGEQA